LERDDIISRERRAQFGGKKFNKFYNAFKNRGDPNRVTQPPVKTTLPATRTTAEPLPKIPPANNWTSNLPNKSGQFESEFDDFNPRDFSSEDPIYLETQRKMAAIKMKERSLAGSSGIELARALVVDESWNQLNKLTQLMEMIMYLQHEPVFSKYCFYGCWCLPYGAEAMGRTAGDPVDEIDATCRAKQLCYKCAQLDYGANCKATVGYRFKGYKLNGERRLRCLDTENTCERALCECDKRLAEKLSYLEDTSSFDYHSKYGDFNYAETCIPKCQNCQKWDQCCGEYPERYPFFSDYGNKGCCGQKTYYKSVLQCCKNDILQPKGTCQYGYGK